MKMNEKFGILAVVRVCIDVMIVVLHIYVMFPLPSHFRAQCTGSNQEPMYLYTVRTSGPPQISVLFPGHANTLRLESTVVPPFWIVLSHPCRAKLVKRRKLINETKRNAYSIDMQTPNLPDCSLRHSMRWCIFQRCY